MNGLFLVALDPSWFMPLGAFRAQVDQLTSYVKTARPMRGTGPVHIPGERSREEAARRERAGIALDATSCAALAAVLASLGLPGDLPDL
jgi:LDH2 family malate/lactate/ureidoglycolate dehydrogenase